MIDRVIHAACLLTTIILYTVAGIVSFKRTKTSLVRRNERAYRNEVRLLIQEIMDSNLLTSRVYDYFTVSPEDEEKAKCNGCELTRNRNIYQEHEKNFARRKSIDLVSSNSKFTPKPIID
uniref:Uncharacterized protein n=1 Tax=Romanomermis culicivorax TaxID=13658 RepID=A0A915J936_ROMCU